MGKASKRHKRTKGRGGGGRRRTEIASLADKLDLYQKSVQAPEVDAEFMAEYFEKYTGLPLRMFREDFCGTAILSCEFVKRHPENRALGVDIHRPTLDWGIAHNLSELASDQQQRVQLEEGDVLQVRSPRAQLTCALNFSYMVFDTRKELLEYFRAAMAGLEPGGLLVLDLWGGGETQILQEEEREIENDDERVGEFTYVWDQDDFDPSTYRTRTKIHFRFADGSSIEDAFVYDWRLWTMPEILELMAEAGFRDVHFLWEGTDEETGEGDEEYERAERGEPDDAWIAYVVGQKP